MTSLFNSLTPTQKRLLILVRSSFWGNLTDPILFYEVSHSEWIELMELAATQGVFGIVYDGIKGLPQALYPAKDLLIKWELGVEEIEKRYHAQIKVLQSLSNVFKENNLKCLLLKGPGIGELYPIPEHRESGDLDIYLFGDYDKGNRLMEESGIIVGYEDEVHSKFFIRSIPVENHFTFLYTKKNQVNREYERVLHQELTKHNSRYSEEYGVWIPSLSFNLLLLFNHAVRHFLMFGIVLRYMCDWAFLLNECRDKKVYMEFYETIKRFGLNRYADAFNLIAEEYLGLSKTDEFVVKRDELLTHKVFTNIMNQKKLHLVIQPKSPVGIFWQKVNGAALLFRNRWKYKAVNDKMFTMELKYRFRNINQIFKAF